MVWAHVEVAVLVSDLVQIEQRLVDRLLQLQGSLHGLAPCAPSILGGLLDVLEDDCTAAVVLELHEGLGVFQLLLRGLPEVLGESGKGHILAFEVVGL